MCACIQQASVLFGTVMNGCRFANRPCSDEPARFYICGCVSTLVADDEFNIVFFAGGNHGIGLPERGCHGFFSDNPFHACLCRCDSGFCSRSLPRRDADDVQIFF